MTCCLPVKARPKDTGIKGLSLDGYSGLVCNAAHGFWIAAFRRQVTAFKIDRPSSSCLQHMVYPPT